MRTFIKRSLKTAISYGAGVFLFTFFVIAPISMETNRSTWIAVYSLIFFIFTMIYLYKQMWKAGDSEKREAFGQPVSPLKGLLYGFAGFSPFLLLEILYFIIYPVVTGTLAGNIFHAVFRCAFGPVFFIIKYLGYTWYSYLLASVVVPLMAFAGFSAGLKGTGIKDVITIRRKDEEDFLS